MEMLQKMQHDEAARNEEMKALSTRFMAADADGDGLLNAAEWAVF